MLIPALSLLFAISQEVRVIDGDTVEIGGEMIRIENIDTPERGWRAECVAERMLAEVASTTLEGLVGKGAPEIERTGRDRYGRTLARLSVAGQDVGQMLIEREQAVPWDGRRHDWCR